MRRLVMVGRRLGRGPVKITVDPAWLRAQLKKRKAA